MFGNGPKGEMEGGERGGGAVSVCVSGLLGPDSGLKGRAYTCRWESLLGALEHVLRQVSMGSFQVWEGHLPCPLPPWPAWSYGVLFHRLSWGATPS